MTYYIYSSYPEAGMQECDCEPVDSFEAGSKEEAEEHFCEYCKQNESRDVVFSCMA